MPYLSSRLRDDRGAATTQLVLVVPVVLLLMLLIVQFALAWHAQHIAQYTAERALAAARVKNATAAEGQAQARTSLAQLGGRVLSSPSVNVRRTAAQATVTVRGAVMPVVPGLDLHATGVASGAVERLTTPQGATP
ncbi:pilus assembly protein [Streptomyces sp. ISL-22]|uniref:TadE/TadG family type IV pilus assembly protein n=1 Tax=unclassified Streptomyces TaxID=2593676 RepID=UPI001BE767AB|nr:MULTISPECIES: TadE/TadG family type IV pilus assembly protein [unclassified Streptomyces]MBT2418061.1 pilus assembly protein [Streptomyces sp. ISL-24]MBT2432264.1 pilus assembly protein [Streptomyces sp. ISL-22]